MEFIFLLINNYLKVELRFILRLKRKDEYTYEDAKAQQNEKKKRPPLQCFDLVNSIDHHKWE